MSLQNRTPGDLATAVYKALQRRKNHPTLAALETLLETMYFASLKTEESEPITFDVIYLDPSNPDPNPPARIVKDRWRFIKFNHPVSLNVSNLIKLAKASDPRTSSFVIFPDSEERLYIWGLVDQGNRYADFINYESDSGPERPGIFQASSVGIGHLITYVGLKKIAELKVNTLVTTVLDVLSDGPIHQKLLPGIKTYLKAVKSVVPREVYKERGHWDQSLISAWIRSVCRLLLRVQRYRHGGALLITPDESGDGLDIKYSITYDRLRAALELQGQLRIEHTFASDQIGEILEELQDYVPMDLYLDETVSEFELNENRREIESAIWFISLLTRVDGLVLLNQRLEVKGFGVEINFPDAPPIIRLALSRYANVNSKMKALDYNHLGTRHRSMMRYCYKVPKSVGFVVSQDGDVRVMTKVGRDVVVWENIKLQLPYFLHDRKIRRSDKTSRDA